MTRRTLIGQHDGQDPLAVAPGLAGLCAKAHRVDKRREAARESPSRIRWGNHTDLSAVQFCCVHIGDGRLEGEARDAASGVIRELKER